MYKKLTATLFKKAVPARYDHINFTPPKGVREEAKRGLKLRREHKRGGLSTQQASKHGIGSGVQRATNLASGARVSPRTVRRMRAFFARHSAYKEHHKDRTSASYISWLLWGGDAGERWANKVYAQMERADDEMKKAGGEQAGHKYLRRIPVARRGKMGYRYIYRRDKRKNLRRKDGEQETKDAPSPRNEIEFTADHFDRLKTLSLEAYEHKDVEFIGEPLLSQKELEGVFASLTPEQADAIDSYTPELDLDFPPFPELTPDEDTWSPDYAYALNEAPQVYAPTFEGISTAPVELNEAPVEDAPTEELSTFIGALDETESLNPVGSAIKNTTSVDGDKLRLPLKDIGKATALSLILLATESYRTLTTNDPNAVSVAEVEGFSKRELNKMDREAVQEAKAKIRESLNKDREEARAKKEEHKKAEREIKEKLRNEAREKKERERAQAKQQREEAKQQREEKRAQEKQQREEKRAQEKQQREEAKQQRERDRAEKERLKQTQREQREQEKKEDTARKEEEAKKQAEKEFEFRREERERSQQAKEEAQVRKEQRAEERRTKTQEAKDKKASERKEAKEAKAKKAKEAKAERDKKAKEAKEAKAKKAKEAKAKKAEDKKQKDTARKKLAEEKKAKQKAETAERRKQAQEQKAKLREQEREHKEKLKRETAEHKEKLKRETAEHKEKLAKERAEQREKLKKVPKKVPKKQAKPAESKPAEKKPAEKKERTRPPRAKKRKARKRRLRKSLVTMYTGRGSDETTS